METRGLLEAKIQCARCGARTEDPPLDWARQVGRAGPEWLCADCTRGNIRAIEAGLDERWW